MLMMESPSMETVYQAIGALYDNPNASEKEKASLWLGDVQKSIHSWKIADELLQQKKDASSCYFAAQTMRSKVQHNLSDLPPEAVISLRDSLVSHLNRTSSDTSPAILTQLCLALADLALQMPSWQNCISDLIKSFSNKNDFALLEILTVLPQEIDSSNLKLGENRREEIKAQLRLHANAVTIFLKESITSSQNTHVALKIVKCMTSWIQVRAINIQEVPQNAVIGFSLQILRDHNSINTLHEAASDCICSLLHCLEDNNNHENIERLLFESIFSLEESYHMAVAHEEEEKAANYARVFTELGETFLEKIIASMASGNTHFAMKSLELALICVGHHDYEVAEITFNLWYRLSEEVYQRDYQPLTDAFKPHIERLIEALARHCQCEPDLANLPEEGDDFYEFRTKVMGLVKDVVFIVGSSSVFRQMSSTLDSNNSWEQTEAALFMMQAVAISVPPEESEVVPRVVEAILGMPAGGAGGAAGGAAAVRRTCLALLGELCDWLQLHPAVLPRALSTLLDALPSPALASTAAHALQRICSVCRGEVRAHAEALVGAARRADDLALPPPASATLMRAVAAAIGALPPPELSEALRSAVAIQTDGLTILLSNSSPIRKHTATDPVLWLDRLAALFRDVAIPADCLPASPEHHPALPALADAWPVLRDTIDKFGGEGRVVERWCRCVRFALRMTGRAAAALLPALAHALKQLYLRHAHSAVLYLASVMVDELAGSAECVAELLGLLQVLLPRTFTLLQAAGALRDHPDTVDDLFRLCVRFLQHCGVQLLMDAGAGAVVRCAALAASLDHREANASVMKFLHDLVRAANHPSQNPAVQALASSVVCAHGEELTCAVLEASVLHLHSYMVADAAEVMLQLLALQQRSGLQWLRSAVRRLPRDRPAHPTDMQCQQFHDAALRADKVKEMTRLLRDFARLYR